MAAWSEVLYSELKGKLRLDPEYYKPHILKLLQKWKKLGVSPLFKYATLKKRRFVPTKNERFDYIEISRVSLSTGSYETISVKDEEAPSRAQYVVKAGDVLLSEVRPNRNAAALVNRNIGRTVCSSGFAVLCPHKVSSEYLFAYLKTSIVTQLLDRETTASMYPAVSDDDVLNLPFPMPDKIVHDKVTDLVKKAFENLLEYKRLFIQAEKSLIKELGLANFKASANLFYERHFRETQQNSRLDAEFFQPKYYYLIESLREAGKKRKSAYLKGLSQPLRYGTSEKLTYVDEGVPFLRIADLENRRFDLCSVLMIPQEEAKKQKTANVSTGDVLISRSGTLGFAVPIPNELNNAIFGSYFIRVRIDQEIVHPEFLALYINSLCGAIQVERLNTGGIQTNLTIPAIENIFIVYGDKSWQSQFVDIIDKSIGLRLESLILLDKAKTILEKQVFKGQA